MEIDDNNLVNKLIILFILDKMGMAVTEKTLLEMCASRNSWINYMESIERGIRFPRHERKERILHDHHFRTGMSGQLFHAHTRVQTHGDRRLYQGKPYDV